MNIRIMILLFLLIPNANARRLGDVLILGASNQNFRECKHLRPLGFKAAWIKRSGAMEDFRYYFKKNPGSKGAILFFHGMGDSACNFMGVFEKKYHRLFRYKDKYLDNFDHYFVEYSGYSTGGEEFKARGFKNPTQKNMLKNALLVYRHIRKEYPRGFKIISMGHSLGTAVATHLAAINNRHISGLVLSAPFTSITEVVKKNFTRGIPVGFFFKGKFMAWDWASAVRAPTLIVVSKQDFITGHNLAKKQSKNFQGPVTFISLEKGLHANTATNEKFFAEFDKFLKKIVSK